MKSRYRGELTISTETEAMTGSLSSRGHSHIQVAGFDVKATGTPGLGWPARHPWPNVWHGQPRQRALGFLASLAETAGSLRSPLGQEEYMNANPHQLALDPAALAFAEATSEPPFLFQLPPDDGRKAVDEVQSSDIYKPEVHEEWVTLETGPSGSVKARIVRPLGATGTLPVILYVHGAGWVFGDAHTHDRLVRDLAIGAHAAVVFTEYDRSPEARYPVALEQCYAVASWVMKEGAANLLDPSRMAVAGDSVGGNMSAALTLLAKQRGDVSFVQQVLFYPVTNAAFDTASYDMFAEGYFLSREGMQWFWDQYTTKESDRAEITASPLRASREELAGLPPALVITAEADVLRDEGESYAAKLLAAGVPTTSVRYGGIIHDFLMLNALHDTAAAKAAVAQASSTLHQALHDEI